MAKPPPHDLEAEAAVIGSMLYWPDTVQPLLGMVEADDFYHPLNRLTFELIEAEHWDGRRVSRADAVAHLKAAGHQPPDDWQNQVDSGSLDARYQLQAEIVVAHRTRRDLGEILREATVDNTDLHVHPDELVARLQTGLARLGTPASDVPDDAMPLGVFMAQDDEKLDPWVIPGMVRRGWRIIVVAGESVGKSTLFRQVALCAASGKHPLDLSPIEPVRTLLVDVENPPGSVVRSLRKLAQTLPDLDPDRVMVWSRHSGMDIATRSDRRAFEAVLAQHRPQLVLIGPLYKTYESDSERDAAAAAAAQRVFDHLRTRYGFGLMIEHHPPHGKEMRPVGSRRWMYWADLGLGLHRKEKGKWHPLVVDRWKGRDENHWPPEIDKGTTMPWIARSPTGTYDNGQGTF